MCWTRRSTSVPFASQAESLPTELLHPVPFIIVKLDMFALLAKQFWKRSLKIDGRMPEDWYTISLPCENCKVIFDKQNYLWSFHKKLHYIKFSFKIYKENYSCKTILPCGRDFTAKAFSISFSITAPYCIVCCLIRSQHCTACNQKNLYED